MLILKTLKSIFNKKQFNKKKFHFSTKFKQNFSSWNATQEQKGQTLSHSLTENLNNANNNNYVLPIYYLNDETFTVRKTGACAQQQRFNKNQFNNRQNSKIICTDNNESHSSTSSLFYELNNIDQIYNSNISINNFAKTSNFEKKKEYNLVSDLTSISNNKSTSAFNQYSKTKQVPINTENFNFIQKNYLNNHSHKIFKDIKNNINQQTKQNNENCQLTSNTLQTNNSIQQYHIYDDTPCSPSKLNKKNNAVNYDQISNVKQIIDPSLNSTYSRCTNNDPLSNLLSKKINTILQFDTESDDEDSELQMVIFKFN